MFKFLASLQQFALKHETTFLLLVIVVCGWDLIRHYLTLTLGG